MILLPLSIEDGMIIDPKKDGSMNKYIRLFVIIGVCAWAGVPVSAKDTGGVEQNQPSLVQTSFEEQIQQAFNAWLIAVSSGSSDAVLKLYAQDAVLLPTLSPNVETTPASRKEYFDAFTAKPNLKGTVNEEHIRVFGDVAVNSGLYTFTYTQNSQKVSIPARFTFVYHKTTEGWLIVDHHSSKLPEMH
jgi:uncharacterized protein (TIGR02246 family)